MENRIKKANKAKDLFLYGIIYSSILFTLGSLIFILGFIFVKGVPNLSGSFFTNNYDSRTHYVNIAPTNNLGVELVRNEKEGTYIISSIAQDSPLRNAVNKSGEIIKMKKGDGIVKILKTNINEDNYSDVNSLLQGEEPTTIKVVKAGKGIFPMIITTLMIVVLSLLISVPIGVFAAIYLVEYAKQGKMVRMIRFSIENLAGIPSIIYGLFGMLFFVTTLKFGYSLLAGALTVSIILLPTIIRTTEEALKAVPMIYREGSFGLGATKLQTIFKVVLPSSVSGIITAIILSVGRIIGESAALLLTAGTVARIPGNLFSSGATLTVKAYTVTKEEGDIGMACAIGVVIILIIMILNFLSKSIGKRLTAK